MTYVDNGHYIMVSAEKIAGTREQWYGKASLVDIGEEGNVSKARLLDNLYRNVLDIFDGVYYMDYTHNCIHTYSSIHGEIPTDIDASGVESQIQAYAQALVHVEDRERFRAFLNRDRLCEEAQASGRSEATGLFRVHREDGRYHWTVFHAIVFFKHPFRDVLLLEREDIWEREQNRQELFQTFASTFSASDAGKIPFRRRTPGRSPAMRGAKATAGSSAPCSTARRSSSSGWTGPARYRASRMLLPPTAE